MKTSGKKTLVLLQLFLKPSLKFWTCMSDCCRILWKTCFPPTKRWKNTNTKVWSMIDGSSMLLTILTPWDWDDTGQKRSHDTVLRCWLFVLGWSIHHCCTPPLKGLHPWYNTNVFYILYILMFSVYFTQKSDIPDFFMSRGCHSVRFHLASQVIWVGKWKISLDTSDARTKKPSAATEQYRWNVNAMKLVVLMRLCVYDDVVCTYSLFPAAIMKVHVEFRHNCREIASSSWSTVETCGEGSRLRKKKRPPPEERPQLVRLFISGAQLEIWTTHRVEPAIWKKGLACPAEDGGGAQ